MKIQRSNSMVHFMTGAIFLSQILVCKVCLGDEMVLRTGKHLEGDIVSFENNEVTMKASDKEFLVDVKMVDDITSDSKDGKKIELIEKISQKIKEHKKSAEVSQKTESAKSPTKKAGIAIYRAGQ